MKTPSPFLFALYTAGLRLYPSYLRLHYQDQLLQTARDAYADSNSSTFWPSLFADLLKSVVKENLLMIRDQAIARPIFFHALTLGIILTVFGIFATAEIQHLLRGGANEPQEQMATLYGSAIASGVKPDDAIPHNNVDIDQSLEPFVIFYDDNGTPITASGYLNRSIPIPPDGVFRYVRSHQTDEITWQPQPHVRIAAVIRRVSGPHSGFLLVGRSLRFVEEQTSTLRNMVFTGWFLVVGLLIAGAALLNRSRLRPSIPG